MVMLSGEADQRLLQGQCRRLGLSDEGDVDDLLDRVQQHVQRTESSEVAERDGAMLRLKKGGTFYAPNPLQCIAVHWPRLVAGAQSGELYHLKVQDNETVKTTGPASFDPFECDSGPKSPAVYIMRAKVHLAAASNPQLPSNLLLTHA